MVERARSTSFALLGLATAVGLGLIALALNQSWPSVADSPVPGPPVSAVHDRAAVGQAAARAQPGNRSGAPETAASSATSTGIADTGHATTAAPTSRATAVVVANPVPASPGDRAPSDRGGQVRPRPASPPPAPEPVAQPVTAPTDPAPAPVPAAPEATASTHPGQGHAHGKASGIGPPGGAPPGQVGR